MFTGIWQFRTPGEFDWMNEIFGQFNLPSAPAALVPLFARGLLHQDPAHRLGGGCEEMPAIGK